MDSDNLTDKQRRFCQEYVYDWNGVRAYQEAYPSCSYDAARANANRLLTKANIKAYIEEVQKDLEKQCGISRQMVLEEYMKIAFNSIAHLHNTWIDRKELEALTDHQKACISEIDTKIMKRVVDEEVMAVEQIKIKLYDKNRALENICKMLGYDAPTKFDFKGNIGIDLPAIELKLRNNGGT